MRKWSLLLSLMLSLVLAFGTTASAFTDLPQGPDRDKILTLQERGIISGYEGGAFRGEQSLTNAEGVHLIVSATGLSLAAVSFFKEPLASDFFDNVGNDSWYAQSFIIAAVHGLELPRDIRPEATMTREAYAHYLLTALLAQGQYGFTKMYFNIADADQLNPDYNNSLQLLLNGRMIQLPEDGKFHPKDPISRHDAAVWAYNVMEFIRTHEALPPVSEEPAAAPDIAVSTEPVNADVNKITLSWGEKPNSGYSLSIEEIRFTADQKAEIHYRLNYPEQDKFYLEVITTPTASTYISSAYKVVPVLVQ